MNNNLNSHGFLNRSRILVIRNLIAVIIFAFLYYIADYIISYNPEFAEKYLLKENITKTEDNSKPLFTLKSPLYYLWFSLITQTTVGYTGVVSRNADPENFVRIRSIPFKILNVLQLLSILLIPAFIFRKNI